MPNDEEARVIPVRLDRRQVPKPWEVQEVPKPAAASKQRAPRVTGIPYWERIQRTVRLGATNPLTARHRTVICSLSPRF